MRRKVSPGGAVNPERWLPGRSLGIAGPMTPGAGPFPGDIEGLIESGASGVLATLVATHGTTPKPVGARMYVGEDCSIVGSVTVGGCVDAEVIGACEAILSDADSKRLLNLPLADEEAEALGLGCGGTVEVLLERVGSETSFPAIMRHLRDLTMRGQTAYRFTGTVAGSGQVLVAGNAVVVETIDDDVVARACLEHVSGTGKNPSSGVLTVGSQRFFVDVRVPHQTLIVVGATDVGVELVKLASMQGYRTVVIDPRPRFATPERFAAADELLVGIPSEQVASISLHPATHVAIVAHDHKIEVPVLRVLLDSDAAYVGLLGGRKRTNGVMRLLLERGVGQAEIDQVHTPIGLDIGARTPAEIALSIMAEILRFRRERAQTGGKA